MKKIFIDAYTKMNLGDDMFIVSLVRRYPHTRFVIGAEEKYTLSYSDEKNLTVVEKSKKNRILRQLEYMIKYDGYVKLGGSIFMEKPNGKKRSHIPRLVSKIFNRNKFVIGANFGPYYSDNFLKRAKASFYGYRGVSFRDSYSAELFSELGNIIMAPDILFGYENYPEYSIGEGIGISVIAPENKLTIDKYADRYYNIIVELCELLISRNVPITLLGFCDFEGDGEAVKRILDKLSDRSCVKTLVYDGDIDRFLNEINGCESIIATRFHAMVIGMAMKKKVYPVIYSPKQLNLLRNIDFCGDMWNMYNGEFPSAERILENCFSEKAVYNTELLYSESKKQFLFLDDFIN